MKKGNSGLLEAIVSEESLYLCDLLQASASHAHSNHAIVTAPEHWPRDVLAEGDGDGDGFGGQRVRRRMHSLDEGGKGFITEMR